MTEKLFFLGTPSFSANILKGILENGITVAGVITGTDKKQGRGYEVSASEVALVAEEYSLPTFKPIDTNELRAILKKEAPDLCLVIAFGMIFPKDLVNNYNFINIHTSLLPKYRGPSPVQTCLLNGDNKTGVTLMKIGEGIDDGDIITIEEVPITETETAESLFEKLEKTSIALLTKELPNKDSWKYLPQNNAYATFTKKIKKDDGYVDLTKENSRKVYNKFQAFYPWPGIYTFQDNQRIKITELQLSDNKLKLLSVQKEGKKPIPYKDFLNSNKPLI